MTPNEAGTARWATLLWTLILLGAPLATPAAGALDASVEEDATQPAERLPGNGWAADAVDLRGDRAVVVEGDWVTLFERHANGTWEKAGSFEDYGVDPIRAVEIGDDEVILAGPTVNDVAEVVVYRNDRGDWHPTWDDTVESIASMDLQGRWLIVGAPEDTSWLPGQARLYQETSEGWALEEVFIPRLLDGLPGSGSFATAFTSFGKSVAVENGTVVVGAPESPTTSYDVSVSAPGSAFVYTRGPCANPWCDSPVWRLTQRLIPATDPAFGLHADVDFGEAVAIAGPTLAIGAPGQETPGDGVGRVYLYNSEGAFWALRGILEPEDQPYNLRFGSAVDAHGRALAVLDVSRLSLYQLDGALPTSIGHFWVHSDRGLAVSEGRVLADGDSVFQAPGIWTSGGSVGVPEQGASTPPVPPEPIGTPAATLPAPCASLNCGWTVDPEGVPEVCAVLVCVGPIAWPGPPIHVDSPCPGAGPLCEERTIEGQTVPSGVVPSVTVDLPASVHLAGSGPSGWIDANAGETRTIQDERVVVSTPLGDVPLTLCPQPCTVPASPQGTLKLGVTVSVSLADLSLTRSVNATVDLDVADEDLGGNA